MSRQHRRAMRAQESVGTTAHASSTGKPFAGPPRGLIARFTAALGLAGGMLLLFGAPAAFAGVGLSTAPQLQSPVAVSATSQYAGNIVITNRNTPPDDGDANSVSNIVFVPSCGAISDPCSVNDPGVFSIVGSTGTGSGACAGLTFAFGVPDPTTGAVTVTPSGPLLIPGGAACTIAFKFMTNKLPAPSAAGPGTRTEQVVSASFMDMVNLLPGATSGTSLTTVTPDAAPACALTGTFPPHGIDITARETDTGLQSIVVTTATNVNVTVPAFTPGTTSPVVVTASRINNATPGHVALTVTDVGGSVTKCDPVLATVGSTGATRTLHIGSVTKAERYISVMNGRPGLRSLTVLVNGKRAAKVTGLRNGQHTVLNIGRYLHNGAHNTVTLKGTGKHMATADVLVSDTR